MSGIECSGQFLPLPDGQQPVSGRATLLVRPERMLLGMGKPERGPAFSGTVREVTYRGVGWRYAVDTAAGTLLVVDASARQRRAERGATVFVSWDAGDGCLIPNT